MTRNVRRWRGRLASVVIGVFAAWLMAEAALAVLGLPRPNWSFDFLVPEPRLTDKFTADAEVFWRMRSRPEADVNRVGLRGRWPALAKRPTDLRIACVGDSSTFGYGVRYDETYGVQLERLLQCRFAHLRVEAVLAALTGYTTYQDRALYARDVAPLAVDVTVLYVGAWNDLMPAVGMPDAERARASTGPRVVRLWRAFATPPLTDAARARYEHEFKEGRVAHDRRVPLAEFRANVAALIESAQHGGRLAVVIVPPLPASTARLYPVTLSYRDAVVETAQAKAAMLLDGNTLLASYATADDGTPCFQDPLHPSPFGHALLAQALCDALMDALQRRFGGRTADAARPQLHRVEPTSVPCPDPGSITLHGAGFADAGEIDRVWIGPHLATAWRVAGDARVEVTLPADLAPGLHEVIVVTARGASRLLPCLIAHAPPLALRVARHDAGHLQLDAECPRLAGGSLRFWIGPRATPPRVTAYGTFALNLPPELTAPGPLARPIDWLRIPLLGFNLMLDDHGRGTVVAPFDGDGATEVWAQGLAQPRGAERFVLTGVARFEVPR